MSEKELCQPAWRRDTRSPAMFRGSEEGRDLNSLGTEGTEMV